MKILVFSWRDPKHPLAGGAEQVMNEHMKGWIKAGHEVTFFSSHVPGLKDEEIIDGVKIIRSGYQYLGVQLAAFKFYIKNKKDYDFLIDEFHGLPFFTPLYSNKPKIAVIQETAGRVWFLNPLIFPANFIVGAIGFLIEPLIFLFYKNTQFATGSLSAKIDVAKMGINPKHIVIWTHGKKIEKLKKKVKKEKKKTICFLGVLSKDKGIFDAIKCFNLLNKVNRDYQFWVIGKPETENISAQVSKLVEELGLNSKVKFWGYVSQTKKFELLNRVHLLINPSIREGWGLVNIEANSVGVPVVSYKAAGLVDSVSHNRSGVFVSNNNFESLAKTADLLLNNKAKYLKLSKSSEIWSKKFNWASSVKTSLKTIKQVSKSRPF